MKNLKDWDKLTTQEKRRIVPWISNYLAKQAHRRRQQVMMAQRQEENNYIEELENEDSR